MVIVDVKFYVKYSSELFLLFDAADMELCYSLDMFQLTFWLTYTCYWFLLEFVQVHVSIQLHDDVITFSYVPV